jgi:hypothetical protein
VVIGSGPLVAKPDWCAGAEVVLARVAEAVLDVEGGLILGTTVVATAVCKMLDGFGCFWAGNKKARY